MEKFADIKLKSYSIKKVYYPEKGYVRCPDCTQLLHCSYCVQHLRNQNPHHWVGITVNEVPGCQGCQERYQRGIAEAKNEANWLRKKLNILEMRLASRTEDLKEAHKLGDMKLDAQELAYQGEESVTEIDLRAQLEDLSKINDEGTESIGGMKLGLDLEKMNEAYEGAESRVAFLKRRPPDQVEPAGGTGSTLPVLGDVTFVIQGQSIYAHQLILGYTSIVFRKMFEELLLKTLEISEPLKVKEIARPIPPILPPPPPPPPPPPSPPPDDHPPIPSPPKDPAEKQEEKPRKKKEIVIPPVVSVRIASSPMLEQMGLRGVRCVLTVAPGQSLVEDATSQTSIPIEGSPDMKHRDKRELTAVNTISNKNGLNFGTTIPDASTVAAPSAVLPLAEHSIEPQVIAPADTHQLTSSPTVATTLPILQSEGKRQEDNVNEMLHEYIALPFKDESGQTAIANKTKSLLPTEPATAQAVIRVHDTSYAVMRAVINCCYTAVMDFTDEVSPGQVLKVAHKYEIGYLRDLCERELCSRLNAGNVAEMLKLGRRFGAKELHSQATQFFKENFDDVQESILSSCCS